MKLPIKMVASVELSLRLNELMPNSKTFLAWYKMPMYDNGWELNVQSENLLGLPAYTVSDLLDFLPNSITLPEGEPYNSFTFFMKKSFIVEQMHDPQKLIAKDYYIVNYECDSTSCSGEDAWFRRMLIGKHVIFESNPANALARLLMCLLEDGLIKNEMS